MEEQLEFKDEVFAVDRNQIVPCYKFADGSIMERECYDNKEWIDSEYPKDAFYLYVNTENGGAIVKTIEEGKKFQKTLIKKEIEEKQEEIKKLKLELGEEDEPHGSCGCCHDHL